MLEFGKVLNSKKVLDYYVIILIMEFVKFDFVVLLESERNIFIFVGVCLFMVIVVLYIFEVVIVVFECVGQFFIVRGKIIFCEGWKEID